jgi:hypothetical protein
MEEEDVFPTLVKKKIKKIRIIIIERNDWAQLCPSNSTEKGQKLTPLFAFSNTNKMLRTPQ